MTDRCHWVHTQDGLATLIPGCWSRVHDPEAECLCGKWDETEAAKLIAAEREACAKVADEYHAAAMKWAESQSWLTKVSDETDSSRIAAAIRERAKA